MPEMLTRSDWARIVRSKTRKQAGHKKIWCTLSLVHPPGLLGRNWHTEPSNCKTRIHLNYVVSWSKWQVGKNQLQKDKLIEEKECFPIDKSLTSIENRNYFFHNMLGAWVQWKEDVPQLLEPTKWRGKATGNHDPEALSGREPHKVPLGQVWYLVGRHLSKRFHLEFWWKNHCANANLGV